MARFILCACILTILICNCSDKVQSAKVLTDFQYFEISFSDGWAKRFSFTVDSNKIYFSPQQSYITYYGILPDTIYQIINTTVLRVRSDSTIKSKDKGCVDCPVIAVKIVSKNDTIRISQAGDLSNIFFSLLKSLETFINSGRHQSIQSVLLLETKSIVTPQPPKIEENKY